MYQLSRNGFNLICQFEALKLVPYNDSNGYATVGIGHLIRKGPVTSDDKTITLDEAYALFQKDSLVPVTVINRIIKVPITQNQFDAMVSLAFNIGVGRFGRSPIPNLINTGHFYEVPAEFLKHVSDAHGNVLKGLVRRRNAEIELFNRLA
jgi:lysozyme